MKSIQKLSLNRETLRILQDEDSSHAVGGAASARTICYGACFTRANTCYPICRTR